MFFLLSMNNISTGHRLRLLNNWRRWITPTEPHVPLEVVSTSSPQVIAPTTNASLAQSVDGEKEAINPSLSIVLKSSPLSQIVYDYYNKHKKLTQGMRDILIKIIALHYAAKGYGSLSTNGLCSLVKQIVSSFEGELEAIIILFIPSTPSIPISYFHFGVDILRPQKWWKNCWATVFRVLLPADKIQKQRSAYVESST